MKQKTRPPKQYLETLKQMRINQLALGIVAAGCAPSLIPGAVHGLTNEDLKKAFRIASAQLKTINN